MRWLGFLSDAAPLNGGNSLKPSFDDCWTGMATFGPQILPIPYPGVFTSVSGPGMDKVGVGFGRKADFAAGIGGLLAIRRRSGGTITCALRGVGAVDCFAIVQGPPGKALGCCGAAPAPPTHAGTNGGTPSMPSPRRCMNSIVRSPGRTVRWGRAGLRRAATEDPLDLVVESDQRILSPVFLRW